jgi:hypothetical protein
LLRSLLATAGLRARPARRAAPAQLHPPRPPPAPQQPAL